MSDITLIKSASEKNLSLFRENVRKALEEKAEQRLAQMHESIASGQYESCGCDKAKVDEADAPEFCDACDRPKSECACEVKEEAEEKAEDKPLDEQTLKEDVLDNLRDIAAKGEGNHLVFDDATQLFVDAIKAQKVLAGFDSIKDPYARMGLLRMMSLTVSQFEKMADTLGGLSEGTTSLWSLSKLIKEAVSITEELKA